MTDQGTVALERTGKRWQLLFRIPLTPANPSPSAERFRVTVSSRKHDYKVHYGGRAGQRWGRGGEGGTLKYERGHRPESQLRLESQLRGGHRPESQLRLEYGGIINRNQLYN